MTSTQDNTKLAWLHWLRGHPSGNAAGGWPSFLYSSTYTEALPVMGNITSHSCCSVTFIKKSKTPVLLLDTLGNIREIKVPVKSAEIMIEEPGHIIAPVEQLRRTRRISALLADEELQAGKVYLLVPASRVHSKASAYEMAIIEKWDCGKKKKKPSGNSLKVSPVSAVSEGKDGGDILAGKITGIPMIGEAVPKTLEPCSGAYSGIFVRV